MWPTDSATEATPEPLLAQPLHTPELPPLEQAFAQTGQEDGYGYSYSPAPAFEALTQPGEQSAQSAGARNNNAIHSSDYSLISDSLQALAQVSERSAAPTLRHGGVSPLHGLAMGNRLLYQDTKKAPEGWHVLGEDPRPLHQPQGPSEY